MFSRIHWINLADPGVGQAASGLGDLGHLVQQLLLAAEELPGGRVGQRAGCGGRDGGDLDLFFSLEVFLGERGPIVVVAHGTTEEIDLTGGGRHRGFPRLGLFPLALDRAAVDPERASERLNRRQEPLLEAGDQQARRGLLPFGLA